MTTTYRTKSGASSIEAIRYPSSPLASSTVFFNTEICTIRRTTEPQVYVYSWMQKIFTVKKVNLQSSQQISLALLCLGKFASHFAKNCMFQRFGSAVVIALAFDPRKFAVCGSCQLCLNESRAQITIVAVWNQFAFQVQLDLWEQCVKTIVVKHCFIPARWHFCFSAKEINCNFNTE